jgi:lysozyme
MTALDILIKLLKEFEGCRLHAYYCPAGILTCGWGQTGHDIKKDTAWTQEYADERLLKSASYVAGQAIKLSPILAHESGRLAAVSSFIYNLGAMNYQASTLRKSVDAGNWIDAQKQIKRWNKARVNGELVALAGLTRRRQAESELLG